eukprot:Skav216831  [mRNA]  locus=scaffold2314:154251:166537:+ [translate_table: standard]
MTIAPALVAAGTSRVHRSAFKLLEFALSLMRLLKFMLSLLPMRHEDSSLVVSPYAGNIPMEQAPQVDDADCVRLTVGSLNPGRSGLANIGNNALLEWRLWAIVGAAKARDIQILVLPGARFPLGARGLIDAAAWARDVLIVLVGHLSGLVHVQAGSRRTKGNAGISGFHEADRLAQRKAVDKYVHQLQSNPQAAEQFLAKFFTRADNFEVHLLDDNGFPLSDAGMLSHLVADMMGIELTILSRKTKIFLNIVVWVDFASLPPAVSPSDHPLEQTIFGPYRLPVEELKRFVPRAPPVAQSEAPRYTLMHLPEGHSYTGTMRKTEAQSPRPDAHWGTRSKPSSQCESGVAKLR